MRKIGFAVFVISLLVLSGCHPHDAQLVIGNASTEVIRLEARDMAVQSIEIGVSRSEVIEFQGEFPSSFEVVAGGRRWFYETPYPPRIFSRPKLVVRDDRSIAAGTLKNVWEPQPDGFPLRPKFSRPVSGPRN